MNECTVCVTCVTGVVLRLIKSIMRRRAYRLLSQARTASTLDLSFTLHQYGQTSPALLELCEWGPPDAVCRDLARSNLGQFSAQRSGLVSGERKHVQWEQSTQSVYQLLDLESLWQV